MLGTTSFPLFCLLVLLRVINGWTAASQEDVEIYGNPNGCAVFHLEKQNLENSSIIWTKEGTKLNCSYNHIQKCKILENGALLLLERVTSEDEGMYTAEVLDNQGNTTHTTKFLMKLIENITPKINISCLRNGTGLLFCDRGRNDRVYWTLNGRILNNTEVFLDDNCSKITVNKDVAGSFMCHINKSTHISNSSATLLNCPDTDENPWSMYILIMVASAGGALFLAIIILIITCCCCCYMKKKSHNLLRQEEDGMELTAASKNNAKDSTSQDGAIAEDKRMVSCTTKATEQALEEDECPPPASFTEQIHKEDEFPPPASFTEQIHEEDEFPPPDSFTEQIHEEDEFPPPDSFTEQIQMHENEEDEFPPPDAFVEQILMHENEDRCQMEDELPDFSDMVENANHALDSCHIILEDKKG
ncbi:uncharacterized protein LOC115470588 isoform X2 [Microcaecilia unicolor]|uniref:Uncharacterized protein LOC115470588 isoform X2 n=1 Tax=Microcaecilia unicolor TaxID=1415580 RepID=A0A6P7Y4A6_9AMPH|nr:uncharacterized protein LOC115470588 isoform X2 [Microcaecilia unicolor]